MECYLDNAATTRALKPVAELVSRVMTEDFGNPSSLHGKGLVAEKYIRSAAGQIAKTLRVDPGTIVFTSGGTESNNTALIGGAMAAARRGRHIITTAFEHPSVSEPLLYLEKQGFEITFLPVGPDGRVSADALKEALRDDTILVSVMWVNNEIGAVQDMAALVQTVKEFNPDILFHTDAVQAYGKLILRPKPIGVDLLSVSGHKFHGPKGTGFLYIADGCRIHPYIHGGGQQKKRRSGTENVPGIAGLGLAAETADREREENSERMRSLRERFIRLITQEEETGDIVVHGMGNEDRTPAGDHVPECAPHIISLGVAGVKAEVLLHALEDRGIYVSSGSACSSNHPGISDTLTAIGVDKNYLDSTIRISLSKFTTAGEIDYTAAVLKELLPSLRRFTKR